MESIGTLGSHGRRRELRDMTFLMRLLFTISPTTRSLDQCQKTLTTPIHLHYGVGGSANPRCARKTSPRSKGRTQRGDMTSGRCQLFDRISQSAETRASGKMCQRPSRCQPMVPGDAIPCGRPWENQDMQKRGRRRHFIHICNGALYMKMVESTKKANFDRRLRGPH